MLLLADLTSTPDNKSIGIEYCQKISEKVSLIHIQIQHTKSIADTHTDTAYKKYRWYLCQCSKSITDTISSDNTAILITRCVLNRHPRCMLIMQNMKQSWQHVPYPLLYQQQSSVLLELWAGSNVHLTGSKLSKNKLWTQQMLHRHSSQTSEVTTSDVEIQRTKRLRRHYLCTFLHVCKSLL